MDEAIKAKMEQLMATMAAINADDLLFDFRPFLVVYKADGRIHRPLGNDTVPAGVDSFTGVESKDVVVSPDTGVFFRLYKPPNVKPGQKVPLLVYIHGGGFVIESAASPLYNFYLNSLSSKANVIIASVDYRLAPEHPLPAAYDDVWSAIQFIAGAGDPWLKDHADFSRAFFAGDSAGANIAHLMAKRVGKKQSLPNFTLNGILLFHPYFWGEERIGSEHLKEQRGGGMAAKLWKFVCPGATNGADDPRINPAKDPELAEMGGDRVLVMVAEEDALRDRGVLYKETLEKSGWKGVVEVVETPEEEHVFFLFKPSSAKAAEFMNSVVRFLNHQYSD